MTKKRVVNIGPKKLEKSLRENHPVVFDISDHDAINNHFVVFGSTRDGMSARPKDNEK